MDVNTFAQWLRRRGHHVYQTESSYWYDAGPKVLQAFPYHWLIRPSPKELSNLILRHNILALRFSTPLDAEQGMVSYHVVMDDPNYSMERLRSQARNGIRRGLENCQVERISLSRLAEEGWKLQQDTLERQNRSNSMKQSEWERICLSAEGLPGFEAWGAVINGELAASILTCQIDDKYYVPYAQSHRKYLGMHVNNALFYVASQDMLHRKGVSGIFYTLQSLDAPESVDEFKFRMNLTARPVRQRIALHPILKPFSNSTVHRIILRKLQKTPSDSFLAKTEGILRFYLLGKLPLKEQNWPECLADQKKGYNPVLDMKENVNA